MGKVKVSDKLLNTEEAARFLRVSEASIRRWSDAGLLPARRVGGRRERRFREFDLIAYLGAVEPSTDRRAIEGQREVNVGGTSVPLHSHVATFYNSDEGRLRLAVPFLGEGIRAGQPCFLVASGEVLDAHIGALRLHDVDIDSATQGGHLVARGGPGP